MSQLVPVSQQGAIWPSKAKAPTPGPRGSRWLVSCPRCGTEGPTGPRGTCRGCQTVLVPDLPVVADPSRRRVPGKSILQQDLLELLPVWISLPARVLGRIGLVLFFLIAFWPVGLVLLYTSVRDGFAALDGTSLATGTTHHVPQRLKLERAWVDASRLRGRRGLVIQYTVQTHGLIGKRLELAVRVRGPDGHYLPALLRRYRGELGEVLVRHATAPLKSQNSRFPKLWVFLPLRAMPIPHAVNRMSVTVEAAFACEGKLLAENHLPYVFVPTADDRTPLELPEAPDEEVDASAITLLEGQAATEAMTCGVCGDSLAGEPVVRCGLCESSSHQECWEYMQGCSTYACEGRPA